MINVKVFYKLFDIEKGQPEGQGQVWVWWCEALMTRSIVCEYEKNLSRNEEVMAKVSFFYNFYKLFDLEKGQPEGQCQVWV